MRYLCLASAMGLLLIAQTAYAGGCASCNGNDAGSYKSYRGPACFSPPGYSLTPGCCECPPSACDNAWDGYCEEKARWKAYFTQVGTPKPHRTICIPIFAYPKVPGGSCGTTSCTATPTVQPNTEPNSEPQPIPAAKPINPSVTRLPAMSPSRK
jgi:hypothetical protein